MNQPKVLLTESQYNDLSEEDRKIIDQRNDVIIQKQTQIFNYQKYSLERKPNRAERRGNRERV